MDNIKNQYEELMYKSDLAMLTSRKAESDWAWLFWANVSERLKEKALLLKIDEVC